MSYHSLLAGFAFALIPSLVCGNSNPQKLAEGQGANGPKEPQAYVSADGTVDVVFAIGDKIGLSTSHDRGNTFTRAKAEITCPNISAGMRRGPRVVRTKTAVVVTAIGGKKGKGQDGDLWAWRSTDDGATWSDGVIINDAADSAREGLHGMTCGPNGDVWCIWLDLRNKKTEIYTSVSRDDGVTWKTNTLAYRSPDGSVCECCHPSIVSGGKSGAIVMFRNSLSGQRDMFLARSSDGKKFMPGRKLGEKSWKLNACPMDGGMLATDGKDSLVTVWQRDNQIVATTGNGMKELSLGVGQQPWVAWSAAGPVIVWTQGREGTLFLQYGVSGKAKQLAEGARDPVIAAHPEGDFAVACWESKQGGTTVVMYQELTAAPGTKKPR